MTGRSTNINSSTDTAIDATIKTARVIVNGSVTCADV